MVFVVCRGGDSDTATDQFEISHKWLRELDPAGHPTTSDPLTTLSVLIRISIGE